MDSTAVLNELAAAVSLIPLGLVNLEGTTPLIGPSLRREG
jgi:hypothetical protein